MIIAVKQSEGLPDLTTIRHLALPLSTGYPTIGGNAHDSVIALLVDMFFQGKVPRKGQIGDIINGNRDGLNFYGLICYHPVINSTVVIAKHLESCFSKISTKDIIHFVIGIQRDQALRIVDLVPILNVLAALDEKIIIHVITA